MTAEEMYSWASALLAAHFFPCGRYHAEETNGTVVGYASKGAFVLSLIT